MFASYHSELLSRKHQNDQKYKFSAKDFIINGVNFDSNYKIIQEINEITLVG